MPTPLQNKIDELTKRVGGDKQFMIDALLELAQWTVREVLPNKDIAKLGSENQETYVAYEHGFNDCRGELLAKARTAGIEIE